MSNPTFFTAPSSSWGRTSAHPHTIAIPAWSDQLPTLIQTAKHPLLAVGLQCSYAESNLNPSGTLLNLSSLDKIMSFNPETGLLRAESGTSLHSLIPLITRHGWFFPTTPGTQFVTLGGAVANDVHGKNHATAGTFGRHVTAMGLMRSGGETLTLKPNTPLFNATIGGLGLTGVITWIEIQLTRIPGAYLSVTKTPFRNLEEFWHLAQDAKHTDAEHTVAWIDTLAPEGRGIFEAADWIKSPLNLPPERTKAIPFTPPITPLNKLSVAAFNTLYFHRHAYSKAPHLQPLTKFFYPLDAIHHWNRLYGPHGFYQYQCALPTNTMKFALPVLLKEVAQSGQASFLAVLKTFGSKPSPGMLSFPMEGATLALDFPNRGATTLNLFKRLDAIVSEANGRLYPAKDTRMPATLFQQSYPQLEEFLKHTDPAFSSLFWQRIAPQFVFTQSTKKKPSHAKS